MIENDKDCGEESPLHARIFCLRCDKSSTDSTLSTKYSFFSSRMTSLTKCQNWITASSGYSRKKTINCGYKKWGRTDFSWLIMKLFDLYVTFMCEYILSNISCIGTGSRRSWPADACVFVVSKRNVRVVFA